MIAEREYQAVMDMVCLAACAVERKIPDMARVAKMDLEWLYRVASRHSMTGITAMALESAGIRDQEFTQAKGKAIRKVTALDLDRAIVLQRLEEEGIWYMPLKGVVLKDLYPKVGMRQMSDNDILFDADRAEDVKQIMEDLGFTTIRYGRKNHDVYYKQPVSNFEMHRALFGLPLGREIREYYGNIKEQLIKDDSGKYAYHFSAEDFYCYMITHEYKHFSISGTGIRSLLDTWVFLKNMEKSLNWEYIHQELEKLGVDSFEKENRILATRLFGGAALTEEDQEMLKYIISSGTFGTITNKVFKRMEKNGWDKWEYLRKRFFVPVSKKNPSYVNYAFYYPRFYRIKILLPLLPFYRVVRAIRKGKLQSEWKGWKNQ